MPILLRPRIAGLKLKALALRLKKEEYTMAAHWSDSIKKEAIYGTVLLGGLSFLKLDLFLSGRRMTVQGIIMCASEIAIEIVQMLKTIRRNAKILYFHQPLCYFSSCYFPQYFLHVNWIQISGDLFYD